MKEAFEYIGSDGAKILAGKFQARGVENVLIVCGKKSFESCGAKADIEKAFSSFRLAYFNDFEVNPKLEDVIEGVRALESFKADAIIAVGGGSAIDVAKSMNVFYSNKGYNPEDLVRKKAPIENQGLLFAALPTTAGTGSEATHFSVIYINGEKFSLAHECMLPDFAVIIPDYTYKLPKAIAASTALDAYCQSIESYWSVGANAKSKEYAARAIKLLKEHIKVGINKVSPDQQGTEASKKALCEAAFYAGKAINITKTTAAHAISYPISTEYGTAHGHAVALNLGKFFVINSKVDLYPVNDQRGVDYLKTTMQDLLKLMDLESSEKAHKYWCELLEDLGLEKNMAEVGILSGKNIKEVVSRVNVERLNNNPLRLNQEELVCELTSLEDW